jgi:hypothetical protein
MLHNLSTASLIAVLAVLITPSPLDRFFAQHFARRHKPTHVLSVWCPFQEPRVFEPTPYPRDRRIIDSHSTGVATQTTHILRLASRHTHQTF